MLWRTRTGVPWRDLPKACESRQTAYGRSWTCSADGTCDQVLRKLMRGSNANAQECIVSVDSMNVRSHHHAAEGLLRRHRWM